MSELQRPDPAPFVPPVIGTSTQQAVAKPSFIRQLVAVFLSLCLGLFVFDALLSLLNDSLRLMGTPLLSSARGTVGFLMLLIAFVLYCLMGLTPMVPKRTFLPVALFGPVGFLLALPLMIFFYNWTQQVAWAISLCQVIVAFWILYRLQGRFKLRWPLVSESHLSGRRFSAMNLFAFLLINLAVLLPATAVYLFLCASVALDHFSDGFVALRPGGLTVQVRNYVRDDGKTIRLIPMSHIGESTFYRRLSQSFPTNATVMMEGVTDSQNLLTNKITYERVAQSLGLSEQSQEFQPSRGEWVYADLDVEEFHKDTVDFINLVMLFHAKGATIENVLKMTSYAPPPDFERKLLNDLLRKRNRHLVEEIEARLPETEHIIVPWGAAHIPEIAREIQKSGFRLDKAEEYTAIQFGFGKGKVRRKAAKSEVHK